MVAALALVAFVAISAPTGPVLASDSPTTISKVGTQTATWSWDVANNGNDDGHARLRLMTDTGGVLANGSAQTITKNGGTATLTLAYVVPNTGGDFARTLELARTNSSGVLIEVLDHRNYTLSVTFLGPQIVAVGNPTVQ
jgi:hypothetical protein